MISLKLPDVFVNENKINFPVTIDRPSANISDPIPETMKKFGMKGTPTLLVFDKQGELKKHHFGHQDDMIVGAEIMSRL